MKNQEMLDLAIHTAVNAHKGQFDRGGKPYILHVLKVMHYTKSEDIHILCAAVLHDSVEDSDLTIIDLRVMGFSDRVIDAVDALTKRDGEEYEDYKQRVFSNRDAMIIKQADLRHNTDIRRLKGITEKDTARLAKYNRFYIEIMEKLRNG